MAKKMSLKERILEHFVSEVPDELARCEFDCSVEECTEEDWVQCENRLKVAAAIQAFRAQGKGDDST